MVQAAVAIAGLAYSVVRGEQQAAAARRGRRDAQEAQAKAESAALADTKRAEEEANKAQQRSPDLNVLLGDALTPKKDQRSIDTDKLLLGRPGPLGI